MTTYRPVAATETDPYAPIVAQLMKALALNPTAITEGAAGAPRIFHGAFGAHTAGDVVIDQIVTSGGTVGIASGSDPGGGGISVSVNFVPEIGTYLVLVAGVIRIKGTVASSGSVGVGITSANLRIMKNNTLASTIGGTFSVDITVAAGDVINFGGSLTATTPGGGGNASVTVSNLRICASELRFWSAT